MSGSTERRIVIMKNKNSKLPDEIIAGAENSLEKEENTVLPDDRPDGRTKRDRTVYFTEST